MDSFRRRKLKEQQPDDGLTGERKWRDERSESKREEFGPFGLFSQ